MWRIWLVLAGANGAFAVALGAVGAHAFTGSPGSERLFETALTYHFWHVPGLLAAAWLAERATAGLTWRLLDLAGTAFVLGTVLFSGSLYLKAWTGAAPVPPLVPVGGLCFILGWLMLVAAGLAGRRRATR